ncbi:hypothetical protein [Streptomyces sp. NPDC056013]|uniref:hypothetical protein n=1 Tax=Streptomyces sp. NPDC056013 TaxID=3345680 RepID=UPI0035DB57F1
MISKKEIDRHGDALPLLKAGLLDGNSQRLATAKAEADRIFNEMASSAQWG